MNWVVAVLLVLAAVYLGLGLYGRYRAIREIYEKQKGEEA